MPSRQKAQRVLFEELESSPRLPQLQRGIQAQLLQQMMQWMHAVASALSKGECDEQDYH